MAAATFPFKGSDNNAYTGWTFAPYDTSVVVTPGTPVPAGRGVFIAVSSIANGSNVRLQLGSGSVLDVPVGVGAQMIDKIAVTGVVAANTTATCVVTVLS